MNSGYSIPIHMDEKVVGVECDSFHHQKGHFVVLGHKGHKYILSLSF